MKVSQEQHIENYIAKLRDKEHKHRLPDFIREDKIVEVSIISEIGGECAEAWFHTKCGDKSCSDMSLDYAIQQVIK